jgi:hypothetical protein
LHGWFVALLLRMPEVSIRTTKCVALQSSVADSFAPEVDGGFFVTMTGDAQGGAPGRIVRLSANYSITGVYPQDPPQGFVPHAIALEPGTQRLITNDYKDYRQTFQPPGEGGWTTSTAEMGGIHQGHSIRVWQLPEVKLLKTYDLGACRYLVRCLLPKHSTA